MLWKLGPAPARRDETPIERIRDRPCGFEHETRVEENMSKPVLYVFAISHYCEKARWALEHLEIEYDLRFLAPGLHMGAAKKLGVDSSTLPILATESAAIQGSAAIVDWADETTRTDKRLTPVEAREQCHEMEVRLDDLAGVHLRRFFYSEALVEHPETVKPIFAKDLVGKPRVFVTFAWPLVRRLMIKGMDLGRSQGEESREILEGEMNWLDEMLADGRRFLVGDRFSRVDLAAASLLGPVADAREHPNHSFMVLPPRAAQAQRDWHDRPCMAWIRGLYRDYR